MLFVSCISIFVSLLSACDTYSYSLLTCDPTRPSTCQVTFRATQNQPVSLQGGSILVATDRTIGKSEKLEVTLTQGSKIKNMLKVDKLEDSVDIVLFSSDLGDFQLGAATLTLTLTPFDGAQPQVYMFNIQFN